MTTNQQAWIGCLVEGDGEVRALPSLLRRIGAISCPDWNLVIPDPIKIKRNRVEEPRELERAIRLCSKKLRPPCGLLVVLDADDDCPAEPGPKLGAICRQARDDIETGVVLANKEFEAWFLAAAESLGGICGLDNHLSPPDDPENIRGAKEWLGKQMKGNRRYSASTDQKVLAAKFDMEAARRRSPSFDKFLRETERLLQVLTR